MEEDIELDIDNLQELINKNYCGSSTLGSITSIAGNIDFNAIDIDTSSLSVYNIRELLQSIESDVKIIKKNTSSITLTEELIDDICNEVERWLQSDDLTPIKDVLINKFLKK